MDSACSSCARREKDRLSKTLLSHELAVRPLPPPERKSPRHRAELPLRQHERAPESGRPREAKCLRGGKKSRDMATGTVKWFNDAKGFGFITQDGGGEDVFCHQSVIQAPGFRSVSEGQKVEFEIKQGPKGLQADKVRVIG